MEGVLQRFRSVQRQRAATAKRVTRAEQARATDVDRRTLRRQKGAPPPTAKDVAAREFRRGNWRPMF